MCCMLAKSLIGLMRQFNQVHRTALRLEVTAVSMQNNTFSYRSKAVYIVWVVQKNAKIYFRSKSAGV